MENIVVHVDDATFAGPELVEGGGNTGGLAKPVLWCFTTGRRPAPCVGLLT